MQRSRKAIAFGPIGTSLASSGATLLCRLKAPNMVRATSCHACCQLIAAKLLGAELGLAEHAVNDVGDQLGPAGEVPVEGRRAGVQAVREGPRR